MVKNKTFNERKRARMLPKKTVEGLYINNCEYALDMQVWNYLDKDEVATPRGYCKESTTEIKRIEVDSERGICLNFKCKLYKSCERV